jgi:hypothetical protein
VDAWVVVVIVAAVLVVLGVVAISRKGRMSGELRLPGIELKTKAEHKTPPATAVIKGSTAGRDAAAKGAGGASIENTAAGRDLTASTDPPAPDPKS